MRLVAKGTLIASVAALMGGLLVTAAGLELALGRSLPDPDASPTSLAFAASVIAAAAVAGVAALLARRALLPLHTLTSATTQSPPDTEAMAALQARQDEVGALARSISEMQQRLEHRNAALTRAYLTVMESEQRLAGIIDHLIEGFVIVEADGTIQRANPAANRIFGYQADELTGEHVAALGWNDGEPEDAAGWLDRQAAGSLAADGDERAHPVLAGRTREGAAVPVELGVTRVEQDGRILYCVLVRDLSQRRRMERAVRESREFLGRVVDLMPVAVFLKDAATLRFTLVNRAMEILSGAPRERIVGRSYADFPGLGENLAKLFGARERALAGGERPAETLQYVLPTRAGPRTVRGTTVALTNESGRVTHLLGVVEDLSEEIAVQHELQTQKQRAEAANRAKSEFLANMSHELRTPLNAIIGYSEMLDEIARDQGRPRESEDLCRIVGAGRHLLTLINAILDLAKSESGGTRACHRPLDVDRLVEDVRSVAGPLMRSNGNHFEVEGSHTGTCVSDEALLRAILTNLLGNAAKFTRGGAVRLHYHVGAAGARFTVHDTGIGIVPEAQGRIFQPFVQADASTSREYGGTGLGLTLCRRYCDQLGGEIVVASDPGCGSVFTVNVPSLSGCSTIPPRPGGGRNAD